jgi:hypothetical protein
MLQDGLPSPVQGTDLTVIDAPLIDVWPLIGDSRNLVHWGPPVIDVSVDGDNPEGLGRNVSRPRRWAAGQASFASDGSSTSHHIGWCS